ncbi:MAG TPA: OmpH family outer membrane protein [Cyclobacteriaceae bacterium]
MKNFSLVINIVLALAVAVLYYLHFATKPASGSNAGASSGYSGDLKLAYINSDTVLKYYDYFKVSREKLEAKGKQMDTDFRNRAQGLQREISNYQNTVANLTIGQARALEEDLTKKQQNLRVYQESLAQELSIEESNLNQELYRNITTYLKDYGTQNGIQIVFKFDPSSDLLFVGDSLNITNDIIKGLNESYSKNTSPAKKDSTKVK